MGRRKAKNFKLTNKNKNKEKYAQKQKHDYSKIKGRVIGQLPDGTPIIGSKSMRVTPLTIEDICPLEIKCINDNRFLSDAPKKFKEVLDKSCSNSLWGNETSRELNTNILNIII